MHSTILGIACVLLGAMVSRAAEPRGPAPQTADLASLSGTWTCEGSLKDPDAGTAQKTRATLTITREKDLGSFWFQGRHVREGAKPLTRLFFWSYDSVMKVFVGGWLDGTGEWLTHTSKGWEEGQLVFVGHLRSGAAQRTGRETFTRPVDGTFKRTFEVMNGGLQWTPVAEETCRKGRLSAEAEKGRAGR
jgi:hypothetical protein